MLRRQHEAHLPDAFIRERFRFWRHAGRQFGEMINEIEVIIGIDRDRDFFAVGT